MSLVSGVHGSSVALKASVVVVVGGKGVLQIGVRHKSIYSEEGITESHGDL